MANVATRIVQAVLVVAGAGLSAGCATPPAAPTSTAAATAPAEAAEKDTGSHLQRPSTYLMVRRIGSSGAREMMRDLPPNPGPAAQ